MLSITIQDQPQGIARPDLTPRLTRAAFSTNLHGDEALQLSAPLSLASAFVRFDAAGTPHAIVTDGAATPFQGRVEDVAIRAGSIDMTALGYSRSMGDARYTALWSDTSVSSWRVVTETDNPAYMPGRYQIDTNNRLSLAPQKGATYANAGANFVAAGLALQIPDGSSRQIVGVSFDYVQNLPVGWEFGLLSLSSVGGGGVSVFSVAGGVGVSPGNRFHIIAANNVLQFYLYYNAAAAAFAGETGSSYVRVTNVRVVTATTNAVNTTTTANVLAGANVNVPVVSSARMYVGQRLHLGIPAALGISATVLSIPDATHFRADLSAAMAAGGNVQAHVIYADEIVDDLISTVSALNSTQLQPDTTQVTSPALDLFNESYADQPPSAILDHLIGLGDNQATPSPWEWGVTGLRQLYYRVAGSVGQTWYVDVTALEVQRSLDTVFNSAYAIYQEASGRTLRGAVATDAASVTQRAITRTHAVSATTTSLTQANVQRDASLADDADPPPRFGITFTAVYNSVGGRAPLWMPRAGDTIVIRNLPPTISVAIDQVRTFRIARTTCDLIARTLTVEPLVPLPRMAALLARAIGISGGA
jgi:hypothetical protein